MDCVGKALGLTLELRGCKLDFENSGHSVEHTAPGLGLWV